MSLSQVRVINPRVLVESKSSNLSSLSRVPSREKLQSSLTASFGLRLKAAGRPCSVNSRDEAAPH